MKQRLIGAAVLVALAVIFLPMLVKGPAPDSGVTDLPLQVPEQPESGVVTRDLPLLTPGEAPTGGALGMDRSPAGDDRLPTVDTAEPHPDAADLASDVPEPASPPTPEPEPEPEPSPEPALPATTAGGGHAVHFGSYSSSVSAETVVNRLRGEQFPARSSEVTVSGKRLWRVHIGPYATRAQAEAVRVRAAAIGSNDARVVALDASPPATAAATPDQPPAQTPPPAAAPDVGFVVQLGAFSSTADASALRDRVRGAGFSAFTDSVQTDKGPLTRVKAGPVVSRAEAERLKSQIQGKTGVDGMVRSHP